MIAYRSFAQNVLITGTTKNESGEILPGVNVVVKGTTIGTASDADGKYSLSAPSNATLVFSFIGYLSEEIAVDNKTIVNVSLIPDIKELSQVVVVGYGTQRKQDLTGAVAVVDTKRLESRNQPNVGQSLQGIAPGVRVSGTNAPGDEPRIEIRGIGTINNNNPLYVVDGIYMDGVANIAPNDIATIQILKDASSAAIYGSRAANGVVVITTKRGKAGDKVNVNFDAFYGVSNIYQRMDVMKREDYQALMRLAASNDGLPVDDANNPNSPNFVSDIDTDWQEEAWRPAPFAKYSLALSGGGSVSRFRVSADYNHRKSMVEGQGPDFKRYNLNINTDQSFKKFKLGQTIVLSKTQGLPFVSEHAYSTVTNILKSLPTLGIYDPNNIGGYAGTESKHNVINLNMIGYNNLIKRENNTNFALAGVNGEYEILKGLFARGTASYNYRMENNETFVPIYRMGYFFANPIARLDKAKIQRTQLTTNAVLNYKKAFGSHNLDAMIGTEYFREDFEDSRASAQGYTAPYAMVINAGPTGRNATGIEEAMAYVSVFGRVNYNYADRYLLTASMRRDANSRFSKENRVGYFPSVAAAWNVHNESFFKQLPQVVSNLKLRTSYGELGNSQMANYQFQPVLNVEAGAVFGGVYQPGATVTNLVNRDVVWESTKSFNVGLDLGIFDNALSLSAEYYRNTTSDILFRVPVPFSAGTIDFPYVNAASMRNSGIELSLNLEKTTSNNFRYSLSGNISTVKNEILELGTDIPIYGAASITKEGGSLGELYGYKVDRLFQSADDVSSSPLQPNAKPGDIKFKDINGDNVINDNDRVVLGKSIPDFTYGFGANFAFKNFDLYTQFFGVHGNKIFNQPRQTIESGGRGRENQLTNQNVTWTPENPNTSNPRASIQDLNGNSTRASDRYVESGSYLRMTDLQLGYNFKSISKAFTNLRIYGSIQNVFVLTKYKGLDPEIVNVGNTFNRGFDPGSFPSPRTFMIGLQVGL